jgi:hypothetical protein
MGKVFTENFKYKKATSVLVTVFISGLLTVWGIYSIGNYGIALFILVPVLLGFGSTTLYGIDTKINYKQAINIGLISLLVYSLGLLLFAIEGLICILMAAPFGILFTWVGSSFGFLLTKKASIKTSASSLVLLITLYPVLSFVEKNNKPSLSSVKTSIEIKADRNTVWNSLIEFPSLDEPSELIFRAGIAYPTDAQIQGRGVGAVRYCNFTTGGFVEPITIWDEPNLLKFSVVEQPKPLQEISFWDINAPHLHDYFVSKEGQFKLTTLDNGNTLLEGTTWYYHNIRPEFYWRPWSNYIIHKIHDRVLNHIKVNSEKMQ